MRNTWSSRCFVAICASLALSWAVVVVLRPPTAQSRAPAAQLRDPLHGWSIFRYRNTPAASEEERLRAAGDRKDARLMARIANQPIATWFTKTSRNVGSEVAGLTAAAHEHHSVALLVAYDIPGQGCSTGASDRGASTTAGYLRWIHAMASGIGNRRAIVIVEPDALQLAESGCPIRLSDLRQAVEILTTDAPDAQVYVDAGNAGWIWNHPVTQIADALKEADVAHAAGFSLNTANFQTDRTSIAYGDKISELLGGAHFVIDTSRNGNGPDTNIADAPRWCNPPGRALGRVPSTQTGVARLDAYLWIKPPGASDEACRPGEPAGGIWWEKYALELAANAAR